MAEEKKPKAKAAKAESSAPAAEALVAAAASEVATTTPESTPTITTESTPQAAEVAALKAAVETAPKPAKAPKAKAPKKEAAPAAAAPEAPKENLSLDPNAVEPVKIIKAKGSKNVYTGIAHVLATFNNTIVSISDLTGNVIGWSSAGKVGFRGSRKSTAYAAQLVAQDACRQAMGHGLKEVEVLVKGPGAGRESAVRAIQAIGLDISVIRDATPVPHNGCRPPKQRRV